MLNVELEIDDLAEFLFKKNKNNALVQLELNGIDDTRDLFCFCIDLLCKGLVLLYGNEKSSVDVDDISFEQFSIIVNKLKNAGIILDLRVENNDSNLPPGIDMGSVYKSKVVTELHNYEFCIRSLTRQYVVGFSLDFKYLVK